MAVTAKLYGLVFKSAFNKEIDFDTDTIKGMLVASTYTPDQDTHQYKSSVTGEITGTGYTAGGATLGSKTVNYTAGTNVFWLGAANLAWPSSTLTARYLVIYDDTPATDATKPLIGYVDFGADVSTTGGTLTVAWDAAGVVTVTAA